MTSSVLMGLDKNEKEKKNDLQLDKGQKLHKSSSRPRCGGVSERLYRVLMKYGIVTATRPSGAGLLVLPKDKM